MLAIGAASKKRLATERVGVKRPKKKKLKRPRGTLFENYTCELDKDNCIPTKMDCALPTKHLQVNRKSSAWSIPLMPS